MKIKVALFLVMVSIIFASCGNQEWKKEAVNSNFIVSQTISKTEIIRTEDTLDNYQYVVYKALIKATKEWDNHEKIRVVSLRHQIHGLSWTVLKLTEKDSSVNKDYALWFDEGPNNSTGDIREMPEGFDFTEFDDIDVQGINQSLEEYWSKTDTFK